MSFLSVVAKVHTLPHLSTSLTSSICLPIDLKWVWPGVPLQDDYLMCCCAELDQGVRLKRSSVLHLQITLHNHFLLPTHSSQAALCAKAEKSTNRGVQSTLGLSTGPYSSSPQCSSLNLPYRHLDGFILKFRTIPPLQCVGSIWMLIPFFIGALTTNRINALPRVQKVKHAGFTFV